MDHAADEIDLEDALHVVSILGDLSMGQPLDHSLRVAGWSTQLAHLLGFDAIAVAQVRCIAMLRWSGCTANAAEVAATITDDVAGRAAMLALQIEKIEFLVSPEAIAGQLARTATIHCEVSGLIAQTLGLDAAVSRALDCVFEHWDGSGNPRALRGEAIPTAAMVVSVCSELEIFSREYGASAALQLLRQRADVVYPAHMVECVASLAVHGLTDLGHAGAIGQLTDAHNSRPQVKMAVVGHAIDLKLPWLTGQSQAVVELADVVAESMGLAQVKRATLRRAAWLHGLGRAAIPNCVLNRVGILTAGDWERIRLAPYWASRAAKYVAGLADAAELASQSYERLDGSGYFRGAVAQGTSLESRILAACVAWVALRADRPWRQALSASSAMAMLRAEDKVAGFDAQVLSVLAGCVSTPSARPDMKAMQGPLLSGREVDVLRRISLGDSNKVAAQRLGISPSTVRTHLESAFKKLDCKTRAACTLKASTLGLLSESKHTNR